MRGELADRLPDQLQPLAAPAAAGLRQLADRAAPKLLADPRVQRLWAVANRDSHREFIRVIGGGGSLADTGGGVVVLNLRPLVRELAARVGVEGPVGRSRASWRGPPATRSAAPPWSASTSRCPRAPAGW